MAARAIGYKSLPSKPSKDTDLGHLEDFDDFAAWKFYHP